MNTDVMFSSKTDQGRLKFGDSTNSAPFPSMVVIFRKGGECNVFN